MDLKGGYVLLPQPIEEEALVLLTKKGIEIVQATDTKIETIAPLMKSAKAIILRTGVTITKELLNQSDNLWMISRTGAGVDNIDIKFATEKGVIVTSSLGVNTTSVAEHCLSLILALFKQLFLMDREIRRNNFKIRYKNYPRDLMKKCLGIIGFGKIGSNLADLCNKLFNMRILAYDPYLKGELKKKFETWVNFTTLDEVFKKSDIVSIHIPLNHTTKGIIDLKYFRLMKPEAFIVNTSRGGVIDEGDLITALSEGIIAGAGLDVFEKEPIEKNNSLLQMENVILTPHSAALTKECVIRMATSAVERVIALFNGYVPKNVANPEVLSLAKWKYLRKKQ